MHIEITNYIRTEFKRLQSQNNFDSIIDYLSSILSTNNADNLLAGFCYWNISDSYAMLRKPDEQYTNHQNFYKLLETMDAKYIFWLVCDATQRFTLELGGYGEFWWEIYKNAILSNKTITKLSLLFLGHTMPPCIQIPK